MSSGDRLRAPAAGPARMRRALVLAGCGVLTVAVSACESTEQESAKLGHESSAGVAGPKALRIGAVNHTVKATSVTLLSGEGRDAIAVRLRSSSSRTQLQLPIRVDVTDSKGKTLYTNSTGGAEASLQHVPLLGAKQSVWWVDDQVPALPRSAHIHVVLGSGKRGPPRVALATGSLRLGSQSGISTVSGRLINRGHATQRHVAVYVVVLRGANVTAAGRVEVESARPGAGGHFQVFLVGRPSGTQIEANPPSAG
jgi:hypothetical protein